MIKPADGYRPSAYLSPEAVQTTGTTALTLNRASPWSCKPILKRAAAMTTETAHLATRSASRTKSRDRSRCQSRPSPRRAHRLSRQRTCRQRQKSIRSTRFRSLRSRLPTTDLGRDHPKTASGWRSQHRSMSCSMHVSQFTLEGLFFRTPFPHRPANEARKYIKTVWRPSDRPT